MSGKKLLVSLTIVFAMSAIFARDNQSDMKEDAMSQQSNMSSQFIKEGSFPVKKVLSNGLTVIVREVHNIPKVSIQLWYNVGSKDEITGEKGIAHLIEHMVFKGTHGKDSLNISESDINVVAHKLSGELNAFTSYDYTGYRFDFPTQHWKEALPIMADCMKNVAFNDQHLNSEMKAVIQELKMGRDNYVKSLLEALLGAVYLDHPYHYPVIGFKQDLWSVNGEDLRKFYKKHYGPANATLIVVGDVNPEEVFTLAQKYFGSIENDHDDIKQKFYINKDMISKSVTLYRDVQVPIELLGFMVPGLIEKKNAILDVISWVLAHGKGSRLYKRLVDETQLVISIDSTVYDLFDSGLFCILYEPKNAEDREVIEGIIFEEIDSIVAEGLRPEELTRAIKKAQAAHFNILENTQDQAYNIGHYYLATGDENYIFNYLQESPEVIEIQVVDMLRTYFRPVVAHRGAVLPLPENEKEQWQIMQQLSDEEDKRILSARVRTEPLGGPHYANDVAVKEPAEFNFPKAKREKLSNGLQVLYHHNNNVPKISISMELKAKSYYDPVDMQGLADFVASMMTEGTENYSATELADAIESRGMSLKVVPGGIGVSLLRDDLPYALEMLQEILFRPTFPEKEIEKVRTHMVTGIKNFWDEPKYFYSQLIKDVVYKGHPYSKNAVGTLEAVSKIKRADLLNFYKKYITPQETNVAIVGDIEGYDVPGLVKKYLGSWQGPVVQDLDYPPLQTVKPEDINYPINRDQVTLAFAGLSITRINPDYDKLQLFEQVFAGGVLGSMNSQLFKLREQTGLFYNIGGTVTYGSDKQPGMSLVKTQVSLDRLEEAQKAIKQAINDATDKVTQADLVEARHAIVNSLKDIFESNSQTGAAFLTLEKYNFPATYFDERNKVLSKITLEQVKEATAKVLNTDQMLTLRVGRL